jgi:hypothetical protein
MENAHQRGYCFGLYAYSLFVLEHYWRHLQKEARCTWVTSNIEVLQELRKRGIRDVAFRDSPAKSAVLHFTDCSNPQLVSRKDWCMMLPLIFG